MVKNFVTKRSDNYRSQFLKKNKGIFGSGIYLCHYCVKPVTKSKMEVDHVMPISKLGGTNMDYNLVPACRKCNRKKSNKINTMVVRGYGFKAVSTVLSVPFKILGAGINGFIKVGWKAKLAIIVGIVLIYINVGV